MQIKFFLLSAICLLILSCGESTYQQPYEMTVKVVDMNDKPLKGRKLNLINGYEQSNHTFSQATKDSSITDNNGSAVFRYNLESSGAFDIVPFVAMADDSTFVATNLVKHGLDSKYKFTKGAVKLEAKIVMDSLIPLKIRFKSKKTNVISFDLRVSSDWKAGAASIHFPREFIRASSQLPISQLDTTISGMVYSKTPMALYDNMRFADGTDGNSKIYTVSANVYRGNVMLIEY
jgi:hypothetical protein